MRLIISNVRSFSGSHVIELKPLTIVVGENSAGKTTLLAAADAVLNDRFLQRYPNFNLPPYDWGSFRDILSSGSNRASRHFSIGIETEEKGQRAVGIYGEDQRGTQLIRAEIRNGDTNLSVGITEKGLKVAAQFSADTSSSEDFETGRAPDPPLVERIDEEIEFPEQLRDTSADWRQFLFAAMMNLYSKESDSPKARAHWSLLFRTFSTLPYGGFASVPGALSIAPVRTKPRRVYDVPEDHADPEGNTVPYILAQALASKSRYNDAFRAALEAFGKESGLFKTINLHRLSRKALWPFQLEIDNTGPTKNMIDVGYGVSQALPIVVQSLQPGSQRLLVQQPEVHLHPRAQAALGQFFVALVAGTTRELIVETHSDYLIDRVRLAVAEGRLSPEKVRLLFLTRNRAKTRVYPIDFDKSGNVLNAPSCYREFFLKEQMRLLFNAD